MQRVIEILLMPNRYAFVEFETEEDAQRAMDQMQSQPVLSRKVYV